MVARRPSSRPASASRNAPVHTLASRRTRGRAARSHAISAGSRAAARVPRRRRRSACRARARQRGGSALREQRHAARHAERAAPATRAARSRSRAPRGRARGAAGRRAREHLERPDHVEALDLREGHQGHPAGLALTRLADSRGRHAARVAGGRFVRNDIDPSDPAICREWARAGRGAASRGRPRCAGSSAPTRRGSRPSPPRG